MVRASSHYNILSSIWELYREGKELVVSGPTSEAKKKEQKQNALLFCMQVGIILVMFYKNLKSHSSNAYGKARIWPIKLEAPFKRIAKLFWLNKSLNIRRLSAILVKIRNNKKGSVYHVLPFYTSIQNQQLFSQNQHREWQATLRHEHITIPAQNTFIILNNRHYGSKHYFTRG